MRVIKTTDPFPIDTLGQLAYYNALDCCSLFEINTGLDELLTPSQLSTYEFEMELLAALLSMEFSGVYIDNTKRVEMISLHRAELAKVQSHLHAFAEAIGYYDYYINQAVLNFAAESGVDANLLPRSWSEWLQQPMSWRREIKKLAPTALAEYQKNLKLYGQPFNGNSPAQKLRLFYCFFGHTGNTTWESMTPNFPPPWAKVYGITEHKTRNVNNEYTPAVDRESLEKIESRAKDLNPNDAHVWAWPFVKCCLEIADLTKTLSFLQSKLEKGKLKTTFGAVTETGRLNSKENAQGFGGNMQNITPRLRNILTCMWGDKITAIDYGQIESRCVAARCFIQFGMTNYMNATECGDLHSLAASMVWENLAWPQDFTLDWLAKHGPFPPDMLKAAKLLASEPFYRGKSRRDVSKTLGHGTSYLGKPAQMSRMSHIDIKLIEHYQAVFFQAFPEIRMWHRWVAEQIQTKGELTTVMGRTRRFFGRPNDDATLREAVAFDPQSTAADYTNTALLRIHKEIVKGNLPGVLLFQKHDELGISFKESLQSTIVPQIISLMEHRIPITSPTGEVRQWYVPTEAEVGWNLGRRSNCNPDGLTRFPDNRTRVHNPFSLMGTLL